ncbi:hypothetical protein VVR12_10195 [Rothia sp. LK2588]
MDSNEEQGGDLACWMHLTCPDCGAIKDDPAAPCWRCAGDEEPPAASTE